MLSVRLHTQTIKILLIVGRQLDWFVGELWRKMGQIAIRIQTRDIGRSHLFSFQLQRTQHMTLYPTKLIIERKTNLPFPSRPI